MCVRSKASEPADALNVEPEQAAAEGKPTAGSGQQVAGCGLRAAHSGERKLEAESME